VADDKVTVPVEMTRAEVEKFTDGEIPAKFLPLVTACRRWLADNPEPEPEPERVVLSQCAYRADLYVGLRRAVPAEALRPGDRVAGRVVESVSVTPNEVWVDWTMGGCRWLPGTLVLLDAEGDQ